MWAPDDRSVAYAFHQQIATDEKTDTEEYAMPEVELQTSGGKVEVTSVNDPVLKPMKMSCIVCYCLEKTKYCTMVSFTFLSNNELT